MVAAAVMMINNDSYDICKCISQSINFSGYAGASFFFIRYRKEVQYQSHDTPWTPICSVVQYQQPKPTPNWMPGSAVGKIFPQIFYSYRQISWRFHFKGVVARHSFIFHFPRSSVRKTRSAVKRYSPGTQFECQPGYRLYRQRLSCLFSVSIHKWRAVSLKQSHSLANHH